MCILCVHVFICVYDLHILDKFSYNPNCTLYTIRFNSYRYKLLSRATTTDCHLLTLMYMNTSKIAACTRCRYRKNYVMVSRTTHFNQSTVHYRQCWIEHDIVVYVMYNKCYITNIFFFYFEIHMIEQNNKRKQFPKCTTHRWGSCQEPPNRR